MNNPYTEAVLNCDLDKQVNKARNALFRYDDYEPINNLIRLYGFGAVHCAVNIGVSQRKKRLKVRQKIGDIVVRGDCVFLTLTFKDEVLARTTEETRRRYVSRFLKSQCDTYVANIDFGGLNGREHYHALVYAPSVDYSKWHKYGAIKGEVVKSSEKDLTRVSKYVVKLARHALKKTAGKGRRIVYSRNIAVDPSIVPEWLFED